MSAFIVISTTESLNWLVDGIVKSRPQNPHTEGKTFIATGKLQQTGDSLFYHYTFGNQEEKTQGDGKELYVLLANQIANFRLKSGVGDGLLQFFLLENPVTDADVNNAKLFHNSLKKVLVERYENNCQVTRVIFSYDISSMDITEQVQVDCLHRFLFERDISDNIHILYLDNQDRNGAAIASMKEERDLMLPRMLCDFLMLYSNSNNAYNIRNAAHSNETGVFSLGYAECMYFFPDIQRFYKVSYKKDIREFFLSCPEENSKVDSQILDYERFPLGLYARKELFKARYTIVPYDKDIKDYIYKNSIDKEIDDIIVSLRPRIESFKQEKIEEAQILDKEETERTKMEAEESGNDPNTILPIKRNVENANKRYPNYIDRNEIFHLWILNQKEDEQFEENVTCNAAKLAYEHLREFIQSSEFKNYILKKELETSLEEEQKNVLSEKKGCNLFAALFHKSDRSQVGSSCTKDSLVVDADSIIKAILSISKLLKERKSYEKLCGFIKETEEELESLKNEIKHFSLTSHSKSYSSLIDLDSLKKYQKENSQLHIDSIVAKWRKIQNGTLYNLLDCAEKEFEEETKNYRYIDWEYPFKFVRSDIDIETVAKELYKRAIPFINTYTTPEIKENQTTYTYYHDRKEWNAHFNELKDMNLPSGTTAELSTHIESKFCMFQILQMDETILRGLTDLHNNKG